jgi:FAD/FMN-containing dehydrogenase
MPDAVDPNAVAALRSAISGQVFTPEDSGYESARLVHNGTVDKRPGIIAQCLNTADIADAIAFARENRLDASVRGGGHSIAGLSVCDGGFMIDLSTMKGVHVDKRSRRVRAQGGVLWREYNRAAHAYGLATTGGTISTTGISGLTLGGGFGWLMSKYGMSVDNLMSVEMVTADGRIRTASTEDEADLFWAVRGAGANFGVVSSFEFDAHPLTSVYGGLVAFSLSDAFNVFRTFREAAQDSPDELMTQFGLVHAPDGSGTKLSAIVACHCGDTTQAERDLQALRTSVPPVLDIIGVMPYPALNTLLDDAFPRRARNYWKSAFLRELSDDAVAVMVDAFKQAPSPMTIVAVEHYHGQATRIGPTDTAFPHRQPGYNLLLLSVWTDPSDDETNISWTRETFSALAPFMADAVYLNYLSADEGGRARAAYGTNWDRLVTLKRQYDPDNFFHHNLNIKPE